MPSASNNEAREISGMLLILCEGSSSLSVAPKIPVSGNSRADRIFLPMCSLLGSTCSNKLFFINYIDLTMFACIGHIDIFDRGLDV